MKRLLFAFCLLMLFVGSASALTVNEDVRSVNNGNGYFNDQDYWEHDMSVFCVATFGNQIQLIDSLGTTVTIMEAGAGDTIYEAIIGSDGYLYYTTNDGVFKRLTRKDSTKYYTDDTDPLHIVQISSDAPVYRLRDDGNYVYYRLHSSCQIKRFDHDLLSPMVYVDYSSSSLENVQPVGNLHEMDFDVYNGEVYRSYFQSKRLRIFNHTGSLILEPTINVNSPEGWDGGMQIGTDGNMYVGASTRDYTSGGTFGYFDQVLHLNGSTKTTGWGYTNYVNANGEQYRNQFYLGQKSYHVGIRNNEVFEIIAISTMGQDFAYEDAGSGDSGTPTSNSITINPDTYYRGEIVTISYESNQAGYLEIRDAGMTKYGGIGWISAGSDTYEFYIPSNQPLGTYYVYMYDKDGKYLTHNHFIIEVDSGTAYLEIYESQADLYDDFCIGYATTGDAYLTIKDPNNLEVYNKSVNTQTVTFKFFSPSSASGTYTASLLDPSGAISDTIIVNYISDTGIGDDVPVDAGGNDDEQTPLVDRNNDGRYSEDEVKEFTLPLLMIFFILLIGMFFNRFGSR